MRLVCALLVAVLAASLVAATSAHADPPAIRIGAARHLGQIDVSDRRWAVAVGDQLVVIRGWSRLEGSVYPVGERSLGEAMPLEGLITPSAGLRRVTAAATGLLLIDQEGGLTRQELNANRLSAPVHLSGTLSVRRNYRHEVLWFGDHLLEVDHEEHIVVRRLQGTRLGPPRPVGPCCSSAGHAISEQHNQHLRAGSHLFWINTRGRVFAQRWNLERGLGRCNHPFPVQGPEALRYPGTVRGESNFDFMDRRTLFVVVPGRLLVLRSDGEVHAMSLSITFAAGSQSESRRSTSQ